jgi:F-type H+-transporting ATPase subunit delta
MADLRAARRYASALFAVAVRQDELETVERDLHSIIDLWTSNPLIAAAMGRPQVPQETKRRIWSQLLEGSAGPLLTRFIEILVDKRRIDLLPEIGGEFQHLADRQRNVVRAQVTTAVPLSPDQAAALKARLGGAGQTVELIPSVDPSIIGGAVVRIGDRIMDGSIRANLTDLRRRLAGTRG